MTWQPPLELPDLRGVELVAIDTETNDEGLRAGRGPGWPWRGGYVCGVSVAWRAGGVLHAIYVPLRHPDTNNFDRGRVARWLTDLFAAPVRIVGLNPGYDLAWLQADLGIPVPPSWRLEDVGALATTIDENEGSYSLEALCGRYGLAGKDEALLRQAVEAAGLAKGRKKVRPQEFIWQLPASVVGPYAEIDAKRPLEIHERAYPILEREGTVGAYRLEMDLLPIVLEMRRRGVRIDQSAAEQARIKILRKRDDVLAQLSAELGTPVSMHELNSPKWKTRTFDALHIGYLRTEKDNPSFTSDWMEKHAHWLPRGIAAANKYHAAGEKFLRGHILDHVIGGRIFAEIHPFRSDAGGARTSRFSYSNPPLQQIPTRDKELGPLIRGVFLPEAGEYWAKTDVSQQEFRLCVHYAVQHRLPGAREAAEIYRSDPDADFHALVAAMTGLDRSLAKAVNFAKIYGAGVKKFAEMIGKPVHEAQAIVAQYDRKLPFVRRLSVIAQDMAERLGYTELYDGARRHWSRYEASGVFAQGAGPCGHDEAVRRRQDRAHPWYRARLRRAHVYTALNSLIQGSAARHTKLWLRAVGREGIIPLIQMHDELSCSVATREQAELVARLGCEAVRLEVPMRVDVKFGRSWGDATHTWEELAGAPAKPSAAPAKPSAAPAKPINGATGTARALQMWDAAEPIAGTPAARNLAEVYLVDLAALPADIDGALRFHPGQGCLLALMRDPISDEPTGVLRILENDRQTLGRAGVTKLWPTGSQLVIGERLETVLAVATRLPYRGALLQPAWVVPSLGRFPVIGGVERLIMLGRNGDAAEDCKRRWAAAGRAGVRLTPERPGADFHDIIMELAA